MLRWCDVMLLYVARYCKMDAATAEFLLHIGMRHGDIAVPEPAPEPAEAAEVRDFQLLPGWE